MHKKRLITSEKKKFYGNYLMPVGCLDIAGKLPLPPEQ